MSLKSIVGKKFQRLTVLGKGRKIPRKNGYRQLWIVQCSCEKVFETTKDFARKTNPQISCGCAKRNNPKVGRKIQNIKGQKFNQLTAIELTGERDKQGQPTWLFKCDCGGSRKCAKKQLRFLKNCGSNNCPYRWLHYPPTPSPYPAKAGEILTKYIHLASGVKCGAIEDEIINRLIRVSFIIY